MERVVTILDHDVHLVGDDGDAFIADLPDVIHEPALDYARAHARRQRRRHRRRRRAWESSASVSASIAPGGRVVAIEASPSTYLHLVDNIATAGATNVETMNVAVGASAGTLEFFASTWFSAGSFVKKETFGASLHQGSTKVPAEPIDDIVERLGIDRLDLIKIDIEGHELPALEGARETLRRFAPAVVVEMNFFTITSLANTMPTDFLSEICAQFPYVYDYAPGEGVFLVAGDLDIYTSVRRQFRTGRPSDLTCRPDPLPGPIESELARRAHRRGRRACAGARITDLEGEVAGLTAELAHLRAQLHDTERDLESATAAAQALQASSSWKLAAPCGVSATGSERHADPIDDHADPRDAARRRVVSRRAPLRRRRPCGRSTGQSKGLTSVAATSPGCSPGATRRDRTAGTPNRAPTHARRRRNR